MKLLHCDKCKDIFSLNHHIKTCTCGSTKGFYFDGENMVYSGKYAIALGIDNYTLDIAQYKQPVDGVGVKFESYVIPLWCNSAIKVKSLKNFQNKKLKSIIKNGDNYKTQWDKKVNDKRTKFNFSRLLYIIGKKLMQLEINNLDKKYPRLKEDWYTDFANKLNEVTKMLHIYWRGAMTYSECYELVYGLIKWKPENMNILYPIEEGEKLAKTVNTMVTLFTKQNPVEYNYEI